MLASNWCAQQRPPTQWAQAATPGLRCSLQSSGIVIGASTERYKQPAGYAAAAAAAGCQWRRPQVSGSSRGKPAWASQPRVPDGTGAADEEEPQLSLHYWLQREQGLKPTAAKKYARQLVRAYGGDEAAALAGLPATFAWCRSQDLTGLQAAKVLDVIAKNRRANVVQFAGTVERDWQLIDSYIREHVQATAGGKARKNIRLADMLSGDAGAAIALVMPPGHVTEWLAAVGQRLTRKELGSLLAQDLRMVTGKPQTALAAMDWAAAELGVTNQMAFFGRATTLLQYSVEVLQRNWGSVVRSLQSAGLTAEQAKQLVQQHASMLTMAPDTLQDAVGWLHQRFSEPGQLWYVVQRGPHLLCCSAKRLRHHADCLQERLGWSSKQISAFIRNYPQPFAAVPFSKPDTAAKLLLLTKVVGLASVGECIGCYGNYLMASLQKMAAVYVLVLEGAPQLLRKQDGSTNLSWITCKGRVLEHCGVSEEQYNAYLRAWPASEEGQRLVAELRAGRTDSWPRPPPVVGAGGSGGSPGDGSSRAGSRGAGGSSSTNSSSSSRGKPRRT